MVADSNGFLGFASACLGAQVWRAVYNGLVPGADRLCVARYPESANPAHCCFPHHCQHFGPPPMAGSIFPALCVGQRTFLSALSSARSTFPTPFCTLPSTCFVTPLSCWVLLPVSCPTFC